MSGKFTLVFFLAAPVAGGGGVLPLRQNVSLPLFYFILWLGVLWSCVFLLLSSFFFLIVAGA